MSDMIVERDWITAAGLRALAVLIPDMHRCGYVEIPDGNPLHGRDYHESVDALLPVSDDEPVGKRSVFTILAVAVDDSRRSSPEALFDVHGGLTFSGERLGGGWWLGFDCGHCGDGSLRADEVFEEECPVRTQEYVEAECESLAEQIVAKCSAAA